LSEQNNNNNQKQPPEPEVRGRVGKYAIYAFSTEGREKEIDQAARIIIEILELLGRPDPDA
jgi:hypothetical protein